MCRREEEVILNQNGADPTYYEPAYCIPCRPNFQLEFLFSSLTVFRTVIMSKIHLAPRGQELGTIELREEVP